MDWPLIMGFVLIATVLEVSPGANFALITRSVSVGGRSAALANIPGFSAAFLLQGALSIFGVAAILAASPGLLNVIQLFGALYLLYLGVQASRRSALSMIVERCRQRSWYPARMSAIRVLSCLSSALQCMPR